MIPALAFALMATQASAAPDRFDALVAAPGNHRVLFENDQVRVLGVTVEPGQTEPPHHHPWPSVFHIDAAQPSKQPDAEP